MSASFAANQYDNAFRPKALANWEIPHQYRQRPRSKDGFTNVVANDRGHLLEAVPRSQANPWADFVGTWDLPTKLPGYRAGHHTARTTYAQEKLQREMQKANHVLSGKAKNDMLRIKREKGTVPVPTPVMKTVKKPCEDKPDCKKICEKKEEDVPVTPADNISLHPAQFDCKKEPPKSPGYACRSQCSDVPDTDRGAKLDTCGDLMALSPPRPVCDSVCRASPVQQTSQCAMTTKEEWKRAVCNAPVTEEVPIRPRCITPDRQPTAQRGDSRSSMRNTKVCSANGRQAQPGSARGTPVSGREVDNIVAL